MRVQVTLGTGFLEELPSLALGQGSLVDRVSFPMGPNSDIGDWGFKDGGAAHGRQFETLDWAVFPHVDRRKMGYWTSSRCWIHVGHNGGRSI